jgi:hypothetical protein
MNYHEGLYRKVMGINQLSSKRPLMIFPSENKVTVTCNDEVLLETTRAEFDNMTVREIVATWDNTDDNEESSNEKDNI